MSDAPVENVPSFVSTPVGSTIDPVTNEVVPPVEVVVPATPVTPRWDVSDIPTITLPVTKATKSHIAAAITAVVGAGQVALEFLPVGPVTQYLSAGIAVISIGAIWLGVYVAPNLPKFTRKP